MTLGLSIPLYNEATLVTEVVASIHAALQQAQIQSTLVLVNNGSEDRTGEIVDDLAIPGEIEVVHLRQNHGYGGGILAGLAHLEAAGLPDIVGWCWGDGQVSPSVLPRLVAAIRNGADMAKAQRTERQDGATRQLVTTAYAATMRLAGVTDPDVNGCPKLMTRACFEAIQPRSADWFLDAEAMIKAEQLGLQIAREPVVMRPRLAGESKVRLQTVGEFALNIGRWKLGRLP
mgnify:CR=1 FL=1